MTTIITRVRRMRAEKICEETFAIVLPTIITEHVEKEEPDDTASSDTDGLLRNKIMLNTRPNRNWVS